MSSNGFEAIVVKVPERFQEGQTSPLKEVVFDKIQQGYRQITLDFSDVVYIDSTGLSTLVTIHKSAMKTQTAIVLRGMNETIRDFFRRTYLDKFLNVVD